MRKKEFKKKLEDFVKDETGSISRDTVLKIGLGTVSALGIMSSFVADSYAAHSNSTHTNCPANSGGQPQCCHTSHSSHNSY